jgi:putative ABC transport system permease protein
MWRNYWTVAIRTLAKSKTYSIINIAGLAIGMAACIMILLYVRYEESYDSWIPDAQNTYELQTWTPHPKGGEPSFMQMAPYAAQGALTKDFPQIERIVFAQDAQPVFYKDGEASSTNGYLFTNDDFLRIVNLPLVAGHSLDAVQTAVITQEEAIKRFGTDQVLGRTLTVISRGLKRDFKITGVLKNIPKNSSMRINAILRLDYAAYNADTPQFLTCWSCEIGWVYLKLRPGTDVKQLEEQEPAWEKRNIPDESENGIPFNAGAETDWHFVNVRDVHLGKAQLGAMAPGNDRKTISTFATIAVLILAMAILNFTNLATARANQRAREVALRKVVGATRKQLIVQFIAESMLFAAIGMLLALTAAELFISPFAAFLNADLNLNYFGSMGIGFPALALTLLVGFASGVYPAFFLSRFAPALVLKANRSAAETPGSARLRTTLVVFQSAISIALIVCTTVIYGQTVFARSVDPGFRRDHILQIGNLDRAQLQGKGVFIADQMKRVPGIVAVGRSEIGLSTDTIDNAALLPPGSNRDVSIGKYGVDPGFFDAMGLRLVSGRWFDPNRTMDEIPLEYPLDRNKEIAVAHRGVNAVINQLAAKELGFKSPQDAASKVVTSELFEPDTGTVNITIIGVVRDTRFGSVRAAIDPLMFLDSPAGESWLVVRYRGNPASVKAGLERQWKRITSDVPFEAKFSEDITRDLYKADEARAEIFAAFSLLALIIGCLGLFGLAAFIAQRRTKEIGIRKVFGARTRDIVQLLVWQFSRPVVLANIVAWPVAWWLMRDWLNTFDQRIALTPIPFVLAGAIALGIAIATVVGHAVKVARANPIHALRYE